MVALLDQSIIASNEEEEAMKKLAVVMVMCMVLAVAGFAFAQETCNVKEPGSMLVFPLVDNIYHSTIIDMANLGNQAVTLECYAITHGPPPAAEDDFLKIDFQIELTERQPLYWDSSFAYNGDGFFIPSLANRKGFVFCWAIDAQRLEIDYDFLKGDALLYDLADQSAFAYNAYPFQVEAINPNRIINMNGVEYCRATSRIYFEAFADGFAGMASILALVNMDNNFPASEQPELDLGFQCWNEDENFGSRNSHMQQFIQLEMGPDLLLDQAGVGTDKFQCSVDANQTGQANTPLPIIGVVTGTIPGTGYEWGGLVWQDPARGANTRVVLWDAVNP
jgi:hypothetical protein